MVNGAVGRHQDNRQTERWIDSVENVTLYYSHISNQATAIMLSALSIDMPMRPWRLSGTVYGTLLNHAPALAALGDAANAAPYKAANPNGPVFEATQHTARDRPAGAYARWRGCVADRRNRWAS